MSADPAGAPEAQGRIFWAWLFTLPVIWIQAATWIFDAPWPNPRLMQISLVALGFPVLFVVGEPIFRSALAAVRQGRLNADLSIALVTSVGWVTGALTFFLPLPNYAGPAAVLMAAYLTVRHLKGQTAES